MSDPQALSPGAARRYLEEFEQELKDRPGVSPEEALSDAREFLLSDAAALARSGEGPGDDDELYAHFVARFGTPADVAGQYATHATPFRARRGYAPGWRICCTKCGRSAPLAKVGGVRIGARSVHKYTLGYCRDCRRLRFLRIVRDLDAPNLTRRLGTQSTPDELRHSMHRPWLTLAAIGLIVAAALFLASFAWAQPAERDARNREAIERLRRAVDQDYSHRDRLGIDWRKRFDEYGPRLLAAPDTEAFARVAAELLGAAKDFHLWLKVGEKTVGTHQPNLRPNFNPRVLPRLIPELKQHGKTVLVGRFPDGIRYVAVGTWERREPDSMRAALEAVRSAARDKAPLVLDVRPNTGGDELLAREVAGLFVDKPTPYAKHVTRSGGKDSVPQTRVLEPDKAGVRHPGPCVVLMGPANVSSCESFLQMMRAAGCTLIGSKSPGASGNPRPHDLGNGVTVMLPSWRDQTLDGRDNEGVGITPDVVVDAKPEQFRASDPVLARALEHLRGE